MENNNFIERLAETLGGKASVKNVFGEPIIVEDKTIIPVAKISYGFGGGFGPGNRKGHKQDHVEGKSARGYDKGGGGGGVSAKAIGLFEVTAAGTRFVPANARRQLIFAACIGFALRGFLRGKKVKRN